MQSQISVTQPQISVTQSQISATQSQMIVLKLTTQLQIKVWNLRQQVEKNFYAITSLLHLECETKYNQPMKISLFNFQKTTISIMP